MTLKRTMWFMVVTTLVVVLIFSFGCSCFKKAKKVEAKPEVKQQPPPPPPPPAKPPVKPPEEPMEKPEPPPPAPPTEEEVKLPPPPAPPKAIELLPVYFAFDKSDLTPEAIATLNKNVAVLKANPDLKVVVEGHCDERGTVEYNMALGERRAKAVRDYYISAGIDKSRIRIISYGEERPIDPGHNEEAWAKNRRSETVKEIQ
ncbi:MAG: peptidoglycan-associated lipoprotein Pal [bacterium]|nr:peptidoglycan-associated lipoprotein Pal [bacterium]